MRWLPSGPSLLPGLVWLLATMPCLGATWSEPFDFTAGTWWQATNSDLLVDPLAGEARPARREATATITFQFAPRSDASRLSASYTVRLGAPGDEVRWEVSRDGSTFDPVQRHHWQSGSHLLELDRYLTAGQPFFVRLALHAAGDPRRVAVSALSWKAVAAARVVPRQPRLSPGCWLAPVAAARQAGSWATSLPPTRPPVTGPGRLTIDLTPWQTAGPRSGEWTMTDWVPTRLAGATTRLLVFETGDEGGSLWVEDRLVARHTVPQMPLGVRLDQRLLPAGLPPRLTARGGLNTRLLGCGPLEIRHLATRWDAKASRLRVAVAVVNHRDVAIAGGLQAALDETRRASAGFRFNPGCHLAELWIETTGLPAWQPGSTTYPTLRVTVDDGDQISDATNLPVGLHDARPAGPGRWDLGGRTLQTASNETAPEALARSLAGRSDRVLVLAAPASRAALAEAERHGLPVVITAPDRGVALAQELVHGGRPMVLAVVVQAGDGTGR